MELKKQDSRNLTIVKADSAQGLEFGMTVVQNNFRFNMDVLSKEFEGVFDTRMVEIHDRLLRYQPIPTTILWSETNPDSSSRKIG
jgi:hypothetical protein